MLTLYRQRHYSVCFFRQNAPQGASSETNTSPTAGIPGVEALEAKNAELEAKVAELEAKIAELEAKDAVRNEENAHDYNVVRAEDGEKDDMRLSWCDPAVGL